MRAGGTVGARDFPLAICCRVRSGKPPDWPGLSQQAMRRGEEGGRGVNTGSRDLSRGCKQTRCGPIPSNIFAGATSPSRIGLAKEGGEGGRETSLP